MSKQWAQKKSGSNSSLPVQKSSSSQRPFTAAVYDALAPKQTPSVQAKRRNVDWNRVTVEAQSPAGVQAKLSVGAPGDKYEQEADAMAKKVMTMPAPEKEKPLQREMASEEKEEEVQTKLATEGKSQAGSNLESQLSGTKGGGSALSDEVRSHMEPRFGADFSSVRVHTDSAAVQMNRDLGAQAFTHGSDIYYGGGKSPGKDELTAHELTHVVQQNGGAVQRAPLIQRSPLGGKEDTETPKKNPLEAREGSVTARREGEVPNRSPSAGPSKRRSEDSMTIDPIPPKVGSEEATKAGPSKRRSSETSKVPTDFAHLLKDINPNGAHEEIVQKLLSNFYARTDFTYTGGSKRGWTHEGDCSTLAKQFIDIAQKEYNIEMKLNSEKEPLFIRGGGKIIDQEGKTGNVDNGAHWRFDNHFWAEWNGQQIDVLFGQMGLKPSEKVVEDEEQGTFTAGGTTYYVSKNGVKSATDRYTSNIEDRWDFANVPSLPRSNSTNRSCCTIM